MNVIRPVKNFLSIEMANVVIDRTINSDKWFFGVSSENPKDETRITNKQFQFWSILVNDDPFFTVDFLQKIREAFDTDFKLISVDINGQTYGMPGSVHIDSDSPSDYTFLYYVNPEWNPMWGGETVFYSDRIVAITPEFNTGVLFPSNMQHFGKEPTRHFDGLRVTVAYKLYVET